LLAFGGGPGRSIGVLIWLILIERTINPSFWDVVEARQHHLLRRCNAGVRATIQATSAVDRHLRIQES